MLADGAAVQPFSFAIAKLITIVHYVRYKDVPCIRTLFDHHQY